MFFYCITSRRVLQAQQRQCASSSSKKFLRSQRKMLVLVCILCICFIPYHLVRLPYTFLQQQCSLVQVFYYPLQLTTVVSVLNVCLDPLVYFIFCKNFRLHMRLGNFRVGSQEVNNARRSVEEQLRTMNINKDLSLSSTSRLTAFIGYTDACRHGWFSMFPKQVMTG
ncbi:hypothetical protein GOODEAATRI_030293 [Goodea atripinnis]|uniref:G-protein coupled receptors family 1 profile domain-containing protein n=1 Tax=Goodea atripinnis TaxID=208336 RepID=A0ABV0MZH4_9TELE